MDRDERYKRLIVMGDVLWRWGIKFLRIKKGRKAHKILYQALLAGFARVGCHVLFHGDLAVDQLEIQYFLIGFGNLYRFYQLLVEK